jgi:glutaminyl-peptide cyclotransferase
MKSWIKVIGLGLFIFLVIVVTILLSISINNKKAQAFDGERSFADVEYQLDLGPRTMGSVAHDKAVSYIVDQLKSDNWQVEIQETIIDGQVIKNIIAKRGIGAPWIILGSHYDSRLFADQDKNPADQTLSVPGANDGASSTAILLELARVLPNRINKQIWLVFFDDEDNGNASGMGWSIGSTYFVSQLQGKPDSVIVLDMLGDKNLNIYKEGNSDSLISDEIWNVANSLGYNQFIPSIKYKLIDDHTPFLNAGIRAVDVIDFNYPYWHTTSDTLDKISAESLKAVGDTVLKWLEDYPLPSTPFP